MIIAPVVAKIEKTFAAAPWFVKLYLRPYDSVLQREIDLAQITEDDVVLNVGCGAIPFSAIYIARKTGAVVYAIDKDPEVVEKAKACVSAMGLKHLIKVFHRAGEAREGLPAAGDQGFSVALVALQAAPKEEIIDRLLKQGKPGIRIIARRPKPGLSSEYDPLPASFSVAGSVAQDMQTFDGSVLYRKGA